MACTGRKRGKLGSIEVLSLPRCAPASWPSGGVRCWWLACFESLLEAAGTPGDAVGGLCAGVLLQHCGLLPFTPVWTKAPLGPRLAPGTTLDGVVERGHHKALPGDTSSMSLLGPWLSCRRVAGGWCWMTSLRRDLSPSVPGGAAVLAQAT